MTWLIAEMWIYLAATAIFALLLGWLLFGFAGRRANRAEQKQLEVERSTSRKRVRDLESRISKLEPAASRVPALEGQARQLQKENKRLSGVEAHVQDVEASARAVPDLERRVVEAESTNQDLRVRLEAIDHLEQANTELQAENDRVSRELSARSARIGELEKDVETLRAERLTLESRLTQVENAPPPPPRPVVSTHYDGDDAEVDLRSVEPGVPTTQAGHRSDLERRMPLSSAATTQPSAATTQPSPTTQTITSPANGTDDDFRRQLAARDRRIETLEARLESTDRLEARVAELESRAPNTGGHLAAGGAGVAGATAYAATTNGGQVGEPTPPIGYVRSESTRDDLTEIVGIGPRLAGLLNNAGITRFDQVASLTDDEIPLLERQIRERPGRVQRDDWRGQASRLMPGSRH